MSKREREDEPAPAYRYRGDGTFLVGIPARDLTSDDVSALDAAAIEAIESSGLYEKAR
jgi:hypothetical protein